MHTIKYEKDGYKTQTNDMGEEKSVFISAFQNTLITAKHNKLNLHN